MCIDVLSEVSVALHAFWPHMPHPMELALLVTVISVNC